jgi:hypothetical protein
LIDRSKQIKTTEIYDQPGPQPRSSQQNDEFISGAQQRIMEIEKYLSIKNPGLEGNFIFNYLFIYHLFFWCD